jgi:hypothetical protein
MKILDHSDCRASTLTVAKGYTVWVSATQHQIKNCIIVACVFFSSTFLHYDPQMLLWRLSNAALDSYLISESLHLDVSGKSVDDIQIMAKEQIHLMNDELESTREKVYNRQEYALEMEGRLKAAVEKIEFHKTKIRMLGASPKGIDNHDERICQL